MKTKQAMAAKFTSITIEEMDKFIKRAFHALHPKQGVFGGTYFYDLRLSKIVAVRITTSIKVHSNAARGVGESSIKVRLVSLKDNRGLDGKSESIVKRTQNWRDNLADRVESLVELYDNKAEQLDSWAQTRNDNADRGYRHEQREDEREHEREEDDDEEEAARDEDGEGDGPSRGPRLSNSVGSWARLKDGTWGVSILDHDVQEGDSARVKRQDGSISTVTLGNMVSNAGGKKYFSISRSRAAGMYDFRGE